MRMILTVLLSSALLFACSDDGLTIEEVCLEKCEINRSKCQANYGTCLNTCKTYSADMESKYLAGCGLCVASTFKYFIMPDGTCAVGVVKGQPSGKECASKCFLPDGGPGY